MKINSTESLVFFLARTYRARIQLIFTNTRGIQYSPYVSLCVSPYRVPNLTLGTKHKYTNEHLKWHLNVPKHGNKHDLIHFVTVLVNCLGGLPRNSVARLTDRARNDIKCVEGP